ncbi:MAG: hypothetical protein K940chlam7_01562 [Chlamydiae bacterium]|nr:hypothetical protein [Chlamydiota bacterium]
MFTTIEQFINCWENASQSAVKIFESLTDESLSQEITLGYRSLGRIAWHIVQTVPEMMGRTGLQVSGLSEGKEVPTDAKTILESYKKVSKDLSEKIKKEWTDETLRVEDDMYGEQWPRAKTCLCLIEHQLHHLGQMTVLMRQAHLSVPGICGPSKEEWQHFGMEPPTI